MKKGRIRKHNIDIMFLMVLFLVFTFSAVSVLLMAINSYKSVVYANEANANARTATAYIREEIRQHDKNGAISIEKLDGITSLKLAVEEGFSLYIYEYDGYLMELEAKDGSGATPDFGSKILQINSMKIGMEDADTINIEIEDTSGRLQNVIVGIKSVEALAQDEIEEESDEE